MLSVSVIIPTYNRSKLLKEAIGSVLSQDYTNIELLIIDDGSTDDTSQVVSAISDSRIKYIYKKNGGVSTARNIGLENATGEFIAFLDSDDSWPKNYLFTMINVLIDNPDYSIAYCLTAVKNPDGNIVTNDSEKRCFSGNITERLFVNSVIWPSALVFKKAISKSLYFDTQLKNAEDSDFILRLSLKGKALFVKNVKTIRGDSADSLSKSAGTNCAKILVLERFYFRGGGEKIVAGKTAFKKIGRSYYRVARVNRKDKNRKAALYLYKKAIKYWPFDLRYYAGLIQSLFITKDNMPEWQMPEDLK